MVSKQEKFEKNNCFACAYSCTNAEGFVDITARRMKKEGIGRVRYRGLLPIADHALSIQQCPVRKHIEAKTEGRSWLGRLAVYLPVTWEAMRKMDPEIRIDQVSQVLLKSKIS